MGSVILENVSKSFGTVDVIKDVSLQIDEGEFCVLIGPSGSGKSTLLRLIAGLEEVSSGKVYIKDRDVTDLPPKLRDIAMVFQTYALYPQMTVRDNMGFALKLAGMPKAEIRQKVDATAKMLQLDQLLDRLPKALSGGQRQRVSMGRAIVRNPTVFLFDEPLSNLDAKLRSQVRGEIADLHTRLSTTSVYVTHDQIEAMTLGQKIVVLKDGKVEQAGKPLELYSKPANTFVAGFIGTPAINLLSADVSIRSGKPHLVFSDKSSLPETGGFAVREGQKVVCGLRPEHIQLIPGTQGEGISATIHSIENTGSDMVIFCETTGGRVTVAFKEQRALEVGQPVTLVPAHEQVHLFDAGSQVRLPLA